MKKTTHILALALVLVMALGLLPITAGAATVTEIAPPKYDGVEDLGDGLVAVNIGGRIYYVGSLLEGGKWGIIDTTGREIVPCKYNKVEGFDQGLAAVNVGGYYDDDLFRYGKWGFIDTTGKEVAPCKYDVVKNFSEGLAAVCVGEYSRDRKWGFIDKTGREVVPCTLEYDVVGDFSEGLAAVKIGADIYGDGGKWGFIDKTGREVVPCTLEYDQVGKFFEGLVAVSVGKYTDSKWGFVDKTGKEVVPCQYGSYDAPEFYNGLAVVEGSTGEIKNGKTVYATGVIDTKGNVVVPFGKYNEIGQFSDGLAAVYAGSYPNDKWGFVDTTGKQVVPCKYDDARDFSEGLAAVKGIRVIDQGITVDGWGFIDKTGKEVVLRKYYGAEDFYGGVAQVRQYYGDYYGHYGFVNKAGVEVAPCIYRQYSSNLQHVSKDIIWANLDDNGYLADRTGKLCEVDYADMREMHEGLVAAMIYGKWGFISIDGYTPTVDQPPAPTAYTAKATNDKLTVGGVSKTPTAYKINNANYFQLRDVAVLLNDTKAQFSVDYDDAAKAIKITTGQPYQPNGKEMKGAKATAEAIVGNNDVYINGVKTDFVVYKIGGSNFFQIRDLGKVLGFNVDWAKDVGIIIDPSKPYSGK